MLFLKGPKLLRSSPSEEKACWLWKIPPPESRRQADTGEVGDGKAPRIVRRKTQMMSVSERLLKEFCCLICKKVMNLPLTTPCAHNFCKACLLDAFAGQTFIKERNCEGRRTLRAQKNIMKCPSCTNDISEYLQNPQVNRELMSVIESLQRQTKEMNDTTVSEEEMLNADEKNDDVKEDDNDEKLEAEVKDVSSEADDISDSAKETVEESDIKEAIAKPSPKANKKRKAGVKESDKDEMPETQVKDSNSEVEEESDSVKESDIKKTIAKGSPKANKKRKGGATGNAPNKKLHEETEILKGDEINDTGDDNKDASVKPEVTESKDLGADEVAKGGKKASKKQKKDGDAKCASPTGAGARTRSKKA